MKAILFANIEWYLFNFRLPLAERLRSQGFDVLLISPPGDYGKRLREAGFRWQPLPMNRRSLNPLRELGLLRHLVQLYRHEQPDVVHHFTIKCVVYGAIAAALARVPARVNAVTGLGYVFTNPALKVRLLRPLVRGLLHRVLNNAYSRLILQNTSDVAAFKQAHIVDDRHIRLIKGSGVDTEHFQPTTEPVLSGPETRVLLASRLLWDKGIGEYVEAARALRAAGLPIRFLLAGAPDPGNPASIPQRQLEAWAAEGVVELLGQVEDMRAQFAQTDIVVLPSYREGLPKSLIEAAACGLPLVLRSDDALTDGFSRDTSGYHVPLLRPGQGRVGDNEGKQCVGYWVLTLCAIPSAHVTTASANWTASRYSSSLIGSNSAG